jgi:hypothetical protein
MDNLKFVLSQRKKRMLILNSYIYNFHSKSEDKTRCDAEDEHARDRLP